MSKENRNSIRLIAVGDIMFGEHPVCLGHGIGSVIERHGCNYVFKKVQEIFSGADVLFGNLENMFIDEPDTSNKFERKYLRPGTMCVNALKYAGFSVMNLANNHALQHGLSALTGTANILEQNEINHIGIAGRNSVLFDVGNIKIGLAGYCSDQQYEKETNYVEPIDLEKISKDVRILREQGADFVVVSLHWGDEFTEKPSIEQVEIGRRVIEVGANLILGHHSHVLQGIEEYKDGIIVYSLGNFIGDMHWSRRLRETMILSLDVSKDAVLKYEIIPVIINSNYQPKPMDVPEKDNLLSRVEQLSKELNSFSFEKPPYTRLEYKKNLKKMRNKNRMGMYRHYTLHLPVYSHEAAKEIFKFFFTNKINKLWGRRK